MTIYDTEDLEAIRQQTRRFVEEEVLPHADTWEAERAVPRAVLEKMGEIGFFGLKVPEEFGGVGFGSQAIVAYAEELGRSTYGGFTITALVQEKTPRKALVSGIDIQSGDWPLRNGLAVGDPVSDIDLPVPQADEPFKFCGLNNCIAFTEKAGGIARIRLSLYAE